MAPVVNHNHTAWFYIVNKVAYMAFLAMGCRAVQHGVSVASHSKLWITSLDLITLARHARSVERVA
jgi:hypothetical protein